MRQVKANATDFFHVTQRKFDVMLMDPHGTGWSSHLTCGFTDASYEHYSNATNMVMNTLVQLPPGPLSKGVLYQETVAYASEQGGPCGAGTESDYYLAHMNTPDVCRDFDLMRNLTGWPTFDYWGFSYGTAIGAMYGQMFPDHVGKMVLDGLPLISDSCQWLRCRRG
jgi:pimeloyl-ACP methyl ester carboxylesterase